VTDPAPEPTREARDLSLSAAEQELIAPEIRTIARFQPDPDARQRYEELAALVQAGAVPADRVEALSLVLEIGLESGRVRRVYGPDGEAAIGRIYRRTPRGSEASAMAAAVTQALSALRGQQIDEIKVTALGPGAYSILVDTRQCQLTIRLDRSGARVDNVALGV
jgi:hypothetical protein